MFHDQRFEKTHDLEVLLDLAARYEQKFDSLVEYGTLLTPFVTLYRYPGDFLEPELDEFFEALDAAESILEFVLSALPPDVHPPRE